MLDIRIEGAKVYDGTGNPWYSATVGVKGGFIAAVGTVKEKARQTIQARGLALCPGFVDVHIHADDIVSCPAAENILRQGVTTVISGNCGGSAFPIRQWLDKVEAARPAINYATLVGHGTIRRHVMGMAGRKPTRRELARMRALAERAMREGAVGMSTGLIYVPGTYAKVDEIVEVAKAVSDYGGVYTSHTRSAGGKLFEALREAATIGKRAKVPVQVSHHKVLHRRGRTRKSRAEETLAFFSRCRQDGLDLTCDVYPYTASFTSLSAVALPSWVSADGKLCERLQDSAIRRRIAREAAASIGWSGGPDNTTIASFPPDRSLEGKSLGEIARLRKRDAVSTAMDLIVEGTLGRTSERAPLEEIVGKAPSCIFHSMRQEDVDRIICSDYSMIGSDGGVIRSRRGVVHPRNYGTFPRVLRQYVGELKLLSLEEAVRKMTSLPARRFGLLDRGMVAVGMKADLILLDPERVADRATFERPHSFPAGIRCVIVNGHVAWDGRSASRRRAGTVIRWR
jgi:N-acyl-D-aspartate/D-glutamate deacylase